MHYWKIQEHLEGVHLALATHNTESVLCPVEYVLPLWMQALT